MRQLLQMVDANLWSQISGAIFLAMFCVVLLWVYWPTHKPQYEQISKLPIGDE